MKNTVTLKKLSLLNFKGIKDLTVEFDKTTNIFGDNGTGKTTIFDAFVWVFFGKDSTDRKDFNVKTLDAHNNVIPKIDHQVTAVVEVNGREVIVSRIMREQWTKKRGSETAEFTGNEILYYWDEVPVKQSEFNAKVNEIVDELVFKMITNPLAFNSLHWKDRRAALVQIVGDVDNDQILEQIATEETRPAIDELKAILYSGKTVEDYRKQIADRIKKAKDDLKMIPARIDEAERSKPQAENFDAIRSDISTKESELQKIDGQIADKSKAYDDVLDAVNKKKLRASELRLSIQQKEQAARHGAKQATSPNLDRYKKAAAACDAKEAELKSAENLLQSLTTQESGIKSDIEAKAAAMADKRAEWEKLNSSQFVAGADETCCPTCKRELDAADREAKLAEMKQSFDAKKFAGLDEITRQGKQLAAEKTSLEQSLTTLAERIEKGKSAIEILKTELAELKAKAQVEMDAVDNSSPEAENDVYAKIISQDANYATAKSELEALEAEISAEIPTVDVSGLTQKKNALRGEIDELRASLAKEAQIEFANNRIAELEREEKNLAGQIAGVERTMFLIENFTKARIENLERRINAKFRLVSFKMFDTQINGGVVECCEVLINGVPFSDANTASKINAGLDIINTLCEYYGITAPIFIDNRESIVNLIPTESQVVNLIVSESDKILRVDNVEQLETVA